jgi:DHA1 family multidrug resistance protein-like MFS transporter
MNQRSYPNVLFISVSQFGIAFSFNFVMVFLPFFIHDISPYSSQETLIWVGFVMGAPAFAAALASTFWGSLASRFSPKTLFMGGLFSHAVIILVMGFVSSLPVLLVLRIVQGILGGISTVGLIIVSSSSSREWAARDIGLYQNAMTLGQLVGPPAGALAATTFGYQGAFISASALVLVTLVFCFFYVKELSPESGAATAPTKHSMNKKTLIAWGLCFTATVQLMFLPSVLPNVFQGFHMEESMAVKSAGLVVMFYTATAMAGTFLLCRLAARVTSHRLIICAGILGTVLQFLLSLSPGVTSFVVFRMLQTAMIAAVMPLVFSSFASDLDGPVIGFLNSSRFAGNALGPMIATAVLAFSSLNWLYISVGSMGLLALVSYAFSFVGARNIDN